MRLIDADALVKEAERLYGEWNKAMAGAEGTRQINKVYKMQELSKAEPGGRQERGQWCSTG